VYEHLGIKSDKQKIGSYGISKPVLMYQVQNVIFQKLYQSKNITELTSKIIHNKTRRKTVDASSMKMDALRNIFKGIRAKKTEKLFQTNRSRKTGIKTLKKPQVKPEARTERQVKPITKRAWSTTIDSSSPRI